MQKGIPGSLIACSLGCGEMIQFIQTRKLDKESGDYILGKKIPVGRNLVWGDGKMTLVVIYPPTERGRVIPKAPPEFQGYEPHFAHCSKYQKQNRRRPDRKPKDPATSGGQMSLAF